MRIDELKVGDPVAVIVSNYKGIQAIFKRFVVKLGKTKITTTGSNFNAFHEDGVHWGMRRASSTYNTGHLEIWNDEKHLPLLNDFHTKTLYNKAHKLCSDRETFGKLPLELVQQIIAAMKEK